MKLMMLSGVLLKERVIGINKHIAIVQNLQSLFQIIYPVQTRIQQKYSQLMLNKWRSLAD